MFLYTEFGKKKPVVTLSKLLSLSNWIVWLPRIDNMCVITKWVMKCLHENIKNVMFILILLLTPLNNLSNCGASCSLVFLVMLSNRLQRCSLMCRCLLKTLTKQVSAHSIQINECPLAPSFLNRKRKNCASAHYQTGRLAHISGRDAAINKIRSIWCTLEARSPRNAPDARVSLSDLHSAGKEELASVSLLVVDGGLGFFAEHMHEELRRTHLDDFPGQVR